MAVHQTLMNVLCRHHNLNPFVTPAAQVKALALIDICLTVPIFDISLKLTLYIAILHRMMDIIVT